MLRAVSPAAAEFVRRVGSLLLASWFAWQTFQRISFFVDRQFPFGLDARIYYRGVKAWLDGANPWDAAVFVGGQPYNYAGTPVTTVIMAPAGLLSEEAFTVAWLILTWAAALWTVRRLGLPPWWLLFPPLTEALFSANPQLVVLALLLGERSILSAVATALKVYAFIPLAGEGRWREIGVAVALNAATIAIAPDLWRRYLEQFGAISERLASQSLHGLSAFYAPTLLVLTLGMLLVLVLLDRRAAGWLAVPAIWPSSQFHYSTMAMPVMSWLMAFVLAIPALLLPPVVIILEVLRRLVVWSLQVGQPPQAAGSRGSTR